MTDTTAPGPAPVLVNGEPLRDGPSKAWYHAGFEAGRVAGAAAERQRWRDYADEFERLGMPAWATELRRLADLLDAS